MLWIPIFNYALDRLSVRDRDRGKSAQFYEEIDSELPREQRI